MDSSALKHTMVSSAWYKAPDSEDHGEYKDTAKLIMTSNETASMADL